MGALRRHFASLGIAAVLAVSHALAAQEIRGHVTQGATSLPIGSVSVSLIRVRDGVPVAETRTT